MMRTVTTVYRDKMKWNPDRMKLN